MSKGEFELNLADGWPQDAKLAFHVNREKLLVEARDASGALPIEVLREDASKLLATLSLFQEGFIQLDTEVPDRMNLTEAGRHLASGFAALRG